MTDHNREEREALAIVQRMKGSAGRRQREEWCYVQYVDVLALEEAIESALRRTVQGEPTDDERADWTATLEALLAEVYTILKPLAETGTHATSSPILKAYGLLNAQEFTRRTVQGEPTDAMIEALGRFSFDGAEGIAFWVGDSDEESTVKVMFSELMDLAKFLCDNFPGLFKAESDGAHLKAEPTDAQVEAAMREHDYSLDRETTRNVLRAAAALAEQGEVEWEYNIAYPRGGEWDPDGVEPFDSEQDALDELERGGYLSSDRIVRRRKPGPWVPVNENGETP